MKSKLLKAAGRFGVRYGQLVKRRIANIESKQRKKQKCLFCNGHAKRSSKGIWECKKCGKRFAAHAYYLEKEYLSQGQPAADAQRALREKAKVLKNEPAKNKKEKKQ
jgi:large subunit ribosomal protein L37Ae